MNALKEISKTLIKGYLFYSTFMLSMYTLDGIVSEPNAPEEFATAESLTQYFSYVSNKTVNSDSEVDLVTPVQMLLIEAGEYLGPCGADGDYGSYTTTAVKNYQQKHKLSRVDGIVDTATYDHLIQNVLKNKKAFDRLENKLIKPYITEERLDLAHNMDEIFDDIAIELIFRPDAMFIGGYELFANDFREDAASMLLPGCANNQLRDAFRHSDSIFRIAQVSGTSAAITIGDVREKAEFHTLPLFLMDVYNHRAAAELYKQTYNDLGEIKDSTEIILNGIKNDKFLLHPFPLVEKGTVDKYAHLKQTPQV